MLLRSSACAPSRPRGGLDCWVPCWEDACRAQAGRVARQPARCALLPSALRQMTSRRSARIAARRRTTNPTWCVKRLGLAALSRAVGRYCFGPLAHLGKRDPGRALSPAGARRGLWRVSLKVVTSQAQLAKEEEEGLSSDDEERERIEVDVVAEADDTLLVRWVCGCLKLGAGRPLTRLDHRRCRSSTSARPPAKLSRAARSPNSSRFRVPHSVLSAKGATSSAARALGPARLLLFRCPSSTSLSGWASLPHCRRLSPQMGRPAGPRLGPKRLHGSEQDMHLN